MERLVIRRAGVADAPGIARVHVDCWRTTYAGIAPEGFLAGLAYETFEERWRSWIEAGPGENFHVAEMPSGIVGFASCGRRRGDDYADYEGELYAIYLLREYQRGGIGRSLFDAVKWGLIEQNVSSMLLWVLSRNPSRQFYEVLGGRLLGSQEIEIGGRVLEEVAYGWQDIRQARSGS